MTVTAGELRFWPQPKNTPTFPAPRPMTERPHPKAIADLALAATSTAVNVGLLFLHYTLKEWGYSELAGGGEALLAELIDTAVQLTGVPDPSPRWLDLHDLALIRVRLVLLDSGVIFEVADRWREPPAPSAAFRSLSKRWNFYPTQAGRVVWCELERPFYSLTEQGLPKRRPSLAPHTQRPPAPPVAHELLRRVREGLEGL